MFLRVSYPNQFSDIQEAMDEVLSDFVAPRMVRSTVFPAVDVAEHDSHYELVVELPGVRKEDVKISMENGVLTLSGERKHYNFPEGTTVLHHESNTRPFSRSFELPAEVNTEAISAELKDGVLRIALPKVEQARAREIRIQ